MNSIANLTRSEKRRLRIWIQRERDARMRTRLTIILHSSKGRSVGQTAAALDVARSTVYRVADRFIHWGWQGLADRREDNGASGVDELFLLELRSAVASNPAEYGFARPTWAQELLCEALADRTGVRVSQATMSRLLERVDARRGRPRPFLRCPWSRARQRRRLGKIDRLIAELPKDEEAVYADEVDIHLNPKIGYDWQLRGQQKRVLTPGQNAKRYVAGALDARTRKIHWVTSAHKRSGLFIDLLRHLTRTYRRAARIHVIVDNYSIHSSRQTTLAIAGLPRITLHFLPPYSPQFNPIERVWLDLHAEVTRNHRCTEMDELLTEVEDYLQYRNRTASREITKAVA